MNNHSLQYNSLRQRLDNTERQLQHLYTLLYALSLEVTKLRNNQNDDDIDSIPAKNSSLSRHSNGYRKERESLPSTSEEPSDAINRLLAATRN